jgi:hypothetical protein
LNLEPGEVQQLKKYENSGASDDVPGNVPLKIHQDLKHVQGFLHLTAVICEGKGGQNQDGYR